MFATWLKVNACTTFTFSNEAGQRVFGRNYDFPIGYGHIQLNYSDMSKTSFIQPPVDRYFNLVLPENYTLIKEVKLTHSGFFKSSQQGEWMKIKGEQSFKTEIPEFQWTGKTKLFKATDRFVNDKGQLKVKLFGLIPIVNAKGSEVDQAELLRWLGESTWFPTNLLPSDHLHWSAIDSLTAKLSFSYKDTDIYYIIRFDEEGLITELETERYMSKGRLEKWIGQVSDYKKFDGMLIPTHIKALWRLEEGDFQYVDFYVNTIDYEY
jgi:hypothetical protein